MVISNYTLLSSTKVMNPDQKTNKQNVENLGIFCVIILNSLIKQLLCWVPMHN